MKKIFFLFIILFNAAMFYFFIDMYKEKDVLDMVNCFQIMKDCPSQSVTFKSDIYEKRNEFINNLKKYADINNVTIVKQSIDTQSNKYTEHIYTSEDLSLITNISVNQKIDFSSLTTEEFYSNYQDNGYELFTLNHQILIDIKPMSYLLNQRQCIGTYDFYAKNQDQLDKYIVELKENYNDYIQEMNNFHINPDNHTTVLNSEMQTLLLFSLVLFATFLAIWISKNSYKNSVYYLNGYSTLEMYMELYGKAFIQGMIISVLSIVLLFIIRIQHMNQRTIPIIFDCCKYLIIQWIGIILIFFIYLFIQKCNWHAVMLKKKNINKILLQSHFFIKIISIIILLPSLTTHCMSMIYNMNNYDYMRRQYSGIENYQYIYGMKYEYQDSQYTEFYEGKTNNTVKMYQKYYDILEMNGAIYYSEEPLYYGTGTLIRTNGNYLSICPILDTDGRVIEMNLDKNKSYLLVPMDLYDSIQVDSFKLSDNEIIEKIAISNNQSHIRHLDSQYDKEISQQHTCLLINSKQNDRKPYGNIYMPINEDGLNDLVKGSIFENTLLIKNLGEILEQQAMLLPALILNDLEIACCFVSFIGGLVIEYFYLYYNIYRKNFAVKKMLGYSFLQLTGSIYVENLCIYGLGLVYFIFKQMRPLYFLLFLFLFDMSIHLVIYGLLYKKNVAVMLKEE